MLNIFGAINNLGYGCHCNNVIKALMDKNIEVNLTKFGQVQIDPYFEPYYKRAEARINEFNVKNPSLFIFHDELSNQACGTPLVVFSVFETTKIKQLSKVMLNNGPANIVFTTTKEHAEILKVEGIEKPIHIVHEGIDDSIYNAIPTSKYIDTKKFTFITVGKNEKRKNTNDIIRAFIEISEGKEVALIAHTFNPFLNKQNDHPFKNLACWTHFDPTMFGFRYVGWNGKAHKFTRNKVDIYFTAPIIQTAEMACLYHSAHVGIQCSRGEGWDLPCSDMLACGMPVIASKCLGHNEYLENLPVFNELLIEPNGTELANDGIWFRGDVGEWNTYRYDDIKDKMRYVIDNSTAYTEKSEKLAEYMANKFSWSKMADDIITILNLGGKSE